MANVNDVTTNLSIPIPNIGNQITYDIGRLRDALNAVDNYLNIHTTNIATKESSVNKGAANGYAPLGADSKVPAVNLPSYVDDVLEAANAAALPVTGETGKIYVTIDNNKIFRWSGSVYIEVSPTVGNSDSATKLATARTIAATGDATYSVSFDGSANVTAAITLANSGVTAGTVNSTATALTPITVNAKGLVTGTGAPVTITPAFASITATPTTVAGYGITNAYTKTEVDTAITNSTPSFTTLTGKPTTLSGYGITDATTSTAFTTHTGDAALHLTSAQNTFIDAVTATSTEVNYLTGVTSAVQTQLNTKLTKSGAIWSDFT
jgi:phage-related tail fiber protein